MELKQECWPYQFLVAGDQQGRDFIFSAEVFMQNDNEEFSPFNTVNS